MSLIPSNMRTAGLTGRDNLFVDVDGTLLLWADDRPGHALKTADGFIDYKAATVNRPLCDELFNWIEASPHNRRLFIWSAGDVPHCEHAAAMCGLTPIATIIPKPGGMIDDSFKWLDRIGRTKIK